MVTLLYSTHALMAEDLGLLDNPLQDLAEGGHSAHIICTYNCVMSSAALSLNPIRTLSLTVLCAFTMSPWFTCFRMYCLCNLNMISEDGDLTFDKFYEWFQPPGNASYHVQIA